MRVYTIDRNTGASQEWWLKFAFKISKELFPDNPSYNYSYGKKLIVKSDTYLYMELQTRLLQQYSAYLLKTQNGDVIDFLTEADANEFVSKWS